MSKYKIIALFGESGSGKDTVLKELCRGKEYNKIISVTTRPIREKELQGVDYDFVDSIGFAEKLLSGDLIEATSFRDWFYGTDIKSLNKEKINVGVFNIASIECLLEDNRLKVYPIYLYSSNKTRLLRSLEREINPDCEEICRRFLADKKDFCDIPFEYISISNKGDLKTTVEMINYYIQKQDIYLN